MGLVFREYESQYYIGKCQAQSGQTLEIRQTVCKLKHNITNDC
jgi:hypothetical protein